MIAAPSIRIAALSAALALPLALLAATPAAAATVSVGTQGDLQAAFAVDDDTVVLSADITFAPGQSLTVDPGESIILDLNSFTLTITEPATQNPAIGVPATSNLTINATGGGTITATGGFDGAGIGGGSVGDGGTITINGGTITATGGCGAAGIGGGFDGDGGTTTINGGTITATGVCGAAGIGGGSGGIAGVLDVNGTPVMGAATNGGDPNASPITNPVQPAGVGYSATTSTVGTGGRIELLFNYLVTFTPNGGSTTANQTIDYDGTVTEPAAPTREGFTFAGWESSGSAYDFSTPVRGPLTLTATWAAALAATGADVDPALGVATLLLAGGITFIALRRRAATRST